MASNVNLVALRFRYIVRIYLFYVFLAEHCLLLVDLILGKSSEDDALATCISCDSSVVVQLWHFFLLIIHGPSFPWKLKANFLFFVWHSALVVGSAWTLNVDHVWVVILSFPFLPLESTLTELIHLRPAFLALYQARANFHIIGFRDMSSNMSFRWNFDPDALTLQETLN